MSLEGNGQEYLIVKSWNAFLDVLDPEQINIRRFEVAGCKDTIHVKQ